MDEHKSLKRIDRREAIKWMAAASASIAFMNQAGAVPTEQAKPILGRPYGTDPNLIDPVVTWRLTLSQEQLELVASLSDVILPADDQSPKASDLGVHDFIDEWISAPYPDQMDDRRIVLEGLAWLDRECQRRFDSPFVKLSPEQKKEICDDIAYIPDALPEFKTAAAFLTKFRNLATGGYYTHPVGVKDIGYVGNVALRSFDGPPPEVLKMIGIDKLPW